MKDRFRSEAAATAVEYALMAAAIAGLIVVIVFALGGTVSESFEDSCEAIARGPNTGSTATC